MREHLVGQALQDDGSRGHPGHLAQHLLGVGAVDGHLSEGLVHLLRRPELGQLGVQHHGVHRLGDLDEPDLPAQLDQR
jgi:hypothetical protein